MAFGLPAKPIQLETQFDPVELEVALPLPELDQVSLYDASKTPTQDAWATAIVQPGDNLSQIFDRLGLKADDLYSLMSCCRESKSLSLLKPGETFKIRTDTQGHLVELVRAAERERALRLFRDGQDFKVGKFQHVIEKRPAFIATTINRTFPENLRSEGLSERLLQQLDTVTGDYLDLKTDLHAGDGLTILFEEDYFSGEKIGDGDILAVDIKLKHKKRDIRIVSFRNRNGELSYYTPEGKSLRPAFLRYPVEFSKISSRFSLSRRHPVLGIPRPHKGVDLAAPRGTPIRAAGAGVVSTIGWQSGYGKTITLDHGRGYTTLYGHMSRFNTKLVAGSRIERGQIIGYVGSTGLATGSHLHYEFRRHNKPQNPLKAKLPGDPPLKGQQRDQFLQQTRPLLAQLDLHRRTRIALSNSHYVADQQ
jgi:murein DD-endopeptidase MepM/ murein hydrolase activator NlpD